MSEETSKPFEMARTMSGDMNAAMMGVAYAYRDMESIEAMYAEHDRLHHEAEARGEQWDCQDLTGPFWDALGDDVVAIDSLVMGVTYKTVIGRLIMERRVREGEVGFVVIEPPREDESEDDYIARVKQAVKDSNDLAAMEPNQKHKPDAPLSEEHNADMIAKFEKFLTDAGVANVDATFEMPTGDEDEDDDPTTRIPNEDGDDHE